MKTLAGTVVSVKMNKTVVVEIPREVMHPLYKKITRMSTRIKAHNTDLVLKDGDKVSIVGVRPISKDKHYKVKEIVK